MHIFVKILLYSLVILFLNETQKFIYCRFHTKEPMEKYTEEKQYDQCFDE